jgi:hypothetical protein
VKNLILGGGEIGSAYAKILDNVYVLDVLPERSSKGKPPKKCDVLHVCLRYTPEFEGIVWEAIKTYKPRVLNVMSTVPPGTTEKFGTLTLVAHSTTRGLHPNLLESIMKTPKHIGGKGAAAVAEVFKGTLDCVLHDHAKTTELAHILSNFLYACEIMAADEMDKLCRAYGVDYFEAVQLYSKSHNDGYRAMGLHSKYRPVLTPPSGKIGGHCVKLPPELIPDHLHGPLMKMLARFGNA